MRKRFEQQLMIGRKLIQDTEIPIKKRGGACIGLFAALKRLFTKPEWNSKVFEILEEEIVDKKNKTGRPGMHLWQILVLSQVRLCRNLSYDELHYLANHDSLLRQMMGVASEYGYDEPSFAYQTIVDNVSLLNDDSIKSLNDIIVQFGHEVFKKKEGEALQLKTDSFVVESNVHFPTDYNLLWDCARKCLDMVAKFRSKHDISDWRKLSNWRRELKIKMRRVGRTSSSGGVDKQRRLKTVVRDYIKKSLLLSKKLKGSVDNFPITDAADNENMRDLMHFIKLLDQHINLLGRRVLQGEKIPHSEKLFSIFETYTEWINKGKSRPNVELGKKASITTDQYHLIVDYTIMDHQSDSQIVPELTERIQSKNKVSSWSFDKGYWHRDNKAKLSRKIETLVMPKKGKCSKEEYAEEHRPLFKKLRNRHSAVESNINELEHRGLNRCPDKGYANFKRYVGLGVCAYNLKKIGIEMIRQEGEKKKNLHKKAA